MTKRAELLAQRALDDIAKEFGPGCSNGIMAILLHDSLPGTFDKSDWSDWFFKPADAAFARAAAMGLIAASGPKWTMTPLGSAAALRAQAAQEPTA